MVGSSRKSTFGDTAPGDLTAFGEVVETTGPIVRLRVPRAKTTEVCREVLGRFPITDLNVQEPPIEDVIRQLFAEHSPAGATPQVA